MLLFQTFWLNILVNIVYILPSYVPHIKVLLIMSQYTTDSDPNLNRTSARSSNSLVLNPSSKPSNVSQIQVTQPNFTTARQTSPGVQRRISIHVKVEDSTSSIDIPSITTTTVTENERTVPTASPAWSSPCLYRCNHTDSERRTLGSSSLYDRTDDMLVAKRSEDSKISGDLKPSKDQFDCSSNIFGAFQPHSMQSYTNRKLPL